MRCESRLKFGLLEELTRSLPSYKQKGEKNLFSKHGFVIFLFTFLANYKKLPWEELPGEDEGV